MKNILVVFTGGTIGSTASEGTINTSSDAPFKLIQQFQQHYQNHQQIHFSTIQPLQILSENLAPVFGKRLLRPLKRSNPISMTALSLLTAPIRWPIPLPH